MEAFVTTSCGTLVRTVWPGGRSAPSWHKCTYVASGWALAGGRQTITTYLWSSGAAQGKHGSRYDAFVGAALAPRRAPRWARVLRGGASLVPTDAVRAVRLEDATRQKTGRQSQGAASSRTGAGTARQA